MKKILIGLLIIGSMSIFAKEICDVNQSNFEDFSVRCSSNSLEKELQEKLAKTEGNRNDLVMMKFMIDNGLELKATRNENAEGDNYSATWIFAQE